ncbi:MAG: hypothetical protein AB1567_02415 [bacterium]
MDEITKDARNAQAILDNPLFIKFFEDFRALLIQQIERSQPNETEIRERSYIYLYYLNKFKVFLEAFINKKGITDKNRKDLELKKKNFLDKFNF